MFREDHCNMRCYMPFLGSFLSENKSLLCWPKNHTYNVDFAKYLSPVDLQYSKSLEVVDRDSFSKTVENLICLLDCFSSNNPLISCCIAVFLNEIFKNIINKAQLFDLAFFAYRNNDCDWDGWQDKNYIAKRLGKYFFTENRQIINSFLQKISELSVNLSEQDLSFRKILIQDVFKNALDVLEINEKSLSNKSYKSSFRTLLDKIHESFKKETPRSSYDYANCFFDKHKKIYNSILKQNYSDLFFLHEFLLRNFSLPEKDLLIFSFYIKKIFYLSPCSNYYWGDMAKKINFSLDYEPKNRSKNFVLSNSELWSNLAAIIRSDTYSRAYEYHDMPFKALDGMWNKSFLNSFYELGVDALLDNDETFLKDASLRECFPSRIAQFLVTAAIFKNPSALDFACDYISDEKITAVAEVALKNNPVNDYTSSLRFLDLVTWDKNCSEIEFLLKNVQNNIESFLAKIEPTSNKEKAKNFFGFLKKPAILTAPVKTVDVGEELSLRQLVDVFSSLNLEQHQEILEKLIRTFSKIFFICTSRYPENVRGCHLRFSELFKNLLKNITSKELVLVLISEIIDSLGHNFLSQYTIFSDILKKHKNSYTENEQKLIINLLFKHRLTKDLDNLKEIFPEELFCFTDDGLNGLLLQKIVESKDAFKTLSEECAYLQVSPSVSLLENALTQDIKNGSIKSALNSLELIPDRKFLPNEFSDLLENYFAKKCPNDNYSFLKFTGRLLDAVKPDQINFKYVLDGFLKELPKIDSTCTYFNLAYEALQSIINFYLTNARNNPNFDPPDLGKFFVDLSKKETAGNCFFEERFCSLLKNLLHSCSKAVTVTHLIEMFSSAAALDSQKEIYACCIPDFLELICFASQNTTDFNLDLCPLIRSFRKLRYTDKAKVVNFLTNLSSKRNTNKTLTPEEMDCLASFLKS